LLQLIDNALKYAFVNTPIEVAIRHSEDETIVRVANEGPPIKPEEQERIFQRFYRGMDSARGPTGTGLGLSIVRKTTEAHGGRVWVDSVGGTTRFFFAIPEYKGLRNG
jgi:two-component system sensor histidine kinase KdpD